MSEDDFRTYLRDLLADDADVVNRIVDYSEDGLSVFTHSGAQFFVYAEKEG